MSRAPRPPADHPQIPVRALLAIVVVMALAVSVIWTVLEQALEPEVTDPFAGATETSGDGTPGNDAGTGSPEAGELAERPGSLADMLGFAPDRLEDDSLPLNDVASYADIAGWMAATGLPQPTGLDDPAVAAWRQELVNLALPTSLSERGLDPVWEASYGFTMLGIDQVLVLGQAPDLVVVMRGKFDMDTLQDAWVANGYQAIELEGTTAWSLSPEDRIDLSAPASRPAMGSFNNIAVLADGVVVASARTSRLESLLEVVAGRATSLADRDDIGTLLAPGGGAERMATAVIAKGGLLQLPPVLDGQQAPGPGGSPWPDLSGRNLLRTVAAAQEMPEVSLVLAGTYLPANQDPGGSPASTPVPGTDALAPRMTLVLVFDNDDDVALAQRIMEARFRYGLSDVTGLPFAMRFGDARFRADPGDGDTAGVVVDTSLRRGIADWQTVLVERDLGFATWRATDGETGGSYPGIARETGE